MIKKITPEQIENILGFTLDESDKIKIKNYNLEYLELDKQKRDECILEILNVLSSEIKKSGEHRIKDWEIGWGENLENFKKNNSVTELVPKYHGKNKIVRWLGDFIEPLTENFDYKIHTCFVDAIIKHYTMDCDNVFEFGCGPAYHLIRLNDKFMGEKKLMGLDWTNKSQELISEINNIVGTEIGSQNFDFFNPNTNVEIPENTGIYTVAALEQVGNNYESFVNFLIEKTPKVCIHIEPIDELLNPDSLVDNLSIKYFRKRNYLNKFLPYLEKLENENKIKIIKKTRTFTGSFFIEGHSLIVWKVL
jgi:hypothetical protein